ncbi:MAG: GNAT family N-acetyltransferase [Acidobacteriota bacterium]
MRRWIFERGILFAADLANKPPVLPPVPATFGEIGAESMEALSAAMGAPDSLVIRERLTGGRRCFAAWVEDRVAAYGWVSQTDECIGEQEREIRLAPREAYVWDCATLKEYRGMGLYSGLLRHINSILRSEGIRCVWIGSSQSNRPSLKGFVNAGFQPVLTLTYFRFFSLRCLWAFGQRSASGALVDAARHALLTDQERARGPFIFGWSLAAALPPCADMDANPRAI